VQVSDPVGFGLTAEEAGNIVLFVPFVPLLALRWPRRWWVAVPAGVAATLAIEATQLWLADHRSPQWNDGVVELGRGRGRLRRVGGRSAGVAVVGVAAALGPGERRGTSREVRVARQLRVGVPGGSRPGSH
jgi:hypothetical protein